MPANNRNFTNFGGKSTRACISALFSHQFPLFSKFSPQIVLLEHDF